MLRKLRFPALVGMTAGVLALVLCTGVPASARGNSCLGAKLKAIGKKESGLLGCSAKGATVAELVRYMKQNALRFAPALLGGDEEAYNMLQGALATAAQAAPSVSSHWRRVSRYRAA